MRVRRPRGPAQGTRRSRWPLGSEPQGLGINEKAAKRLGLTHLSRDNVLNASQSANSSCGILATGPSSMPPVSPQPSCSSPYAPGKTERCMEGDRAGLGFVFT